MFADMTSDTVMSSPLAALLRVVPSQAAKITSASTRGKAVAYSFECQEEDPFSEVCIDHIWAATLHGSLAASLALLVPGIPPRDRRILLALASMPIALSVLSDTREQ